MDQTAEYYPLENHRARISEFSSGELNKFRELLFDSKQMNPEIIGAVVYGSHLKGVARGPEHPQGRSDVDAYIFVDANKAGIDDTGKQVGIYPDDTDLGWEIINEKIGIPLRNRMKEVFTLTNSQVKDARVRLLSQKRIDNEINSLINWENTVEKRKQVSSDGSVNPPLPHTQLGLLFHMQIGRGLDEYRSYILQRLQQIGPAGDTIWRQHIISHTEMMESGKIPREVGIKRSDNHLYPLTVTDAIKNYHIQYTAPKYPIKSLK